MKPKTKPSFNEEQILWDKGVINIAGIDEVGRGAFAGPLVAASVILTPNFDPKDINDSKKLSAHKREELSKYILENALCYQIEEIDVQTINEIGIGKATQVAFLNSLNNLRLKSDFALIDGFLINNLDINKQKAIVRGDSKSVSIAAASIIAKVYRDNLMVKLHEFFPEYNFLENKGYGTKFHRDTLKKFGLSKIHRTSFDLNKFL